MDKNPQQNQTLVTGAGATPDNAKSSSALVSEEELVLLGAINGVFGVKGWLKVFSDTEPRENIVKYKSWLISRQSSRSASVDWREIRLLEGKRHSKNVIVRLQGIDSREQAESLVGYQVAVRKDQLPKLPDGEYYWSDLIGLEVRNTDGRVLGTVKRLFETGANDVMVVDSGSLADSGSEPSAASSGGIEILIPWVLDHFVLEVDRVERRILVDWQEDY